jgi:Na+-transporting methylmalonyl-CoA/oxaloacetate decarboxylase gamma subunit
MQAHTTEPLVLAGVGMAIVFFVLALITTVVALLGRLDRRAAERNDSPPAAEEVTPTVDGTTLAIIAATVHTLLQGRALIHRVRRLPPLASQQSSWSQQGRAVLHGSHVITGRRR